MNLSHLLSFVVLRASLHLLCATSLIGILWTATASAAPSSSTEALEALAFQQRFDRQAASYVLRHTDSAEIAELAQRILDESMVLSRTLRPLVTSMKRPSRPRTTTETLRALQSQRDSRLDRTFLSSLMLSRAAALAELQDLALGRRSSALGSAREAARSLLERQLVLTELNQALLATVSGTTTPGTGTAGSTLGNMVVLGNSGTTGTAGSTTNTIILPSSVVNGQEISSLSLGNGAVLTCQCPIAATSTSSSGSTLGGGGISVPSNSNGSVGNTSSLGSTLAQPQSVGATSTGGSSGASTGGSSTSSTASLVGQSSPGTGTSVIVATATPNGILSGTTFGAGFVTPTPSASVILDSNNGFTDVRPGGFIGIPTNNGNF